MPTKAERSQALEDLIGHRSGSRACHEAIKAIDQVLVMSGSIETNASERKQLEDVGGILSRLQSKCHRKERANEEVLTSD